MPFDQGKLEKMSITAFVAQSKTDEPPQVSDRPEDHYVVQVNPDSYTLQHRIEYAERRGQGDSGSDAVYSGTQPTGMEFEFLFDATGVVPPPSAVSEEEPFEVMQEIEKFNRVVLDYHGEGHRPRKVQLVWGEELMNCALVSLSYRFTLFKPDGTPLRAIAKCSFREAEPDCLREKKENNQSADLTHLREVQEGDTLPLMAYRIYNDSTLYLEVARANKLINFRRLQAGRRLRFPPIAKQS